MYQVEAQDKKAYLGRQSGGSSGTHGILEVGHGGLIKPPCFIGLDTLYSNELLPPFKMLLTGLRHLQRIFWTELLDPAKNHIHDRIIRLWISSPFTHWLPT